MQGLASQGCCGIYSSKTHCFCAYRLQADPCNRLSQLMMTVSGGSTRAAEPAKLGAAANENGAGSGPSRRTLRKASLRGSFTTRSSLPLPLSPLSWRRLLVFLCWMSVCLLTFIFVHDHNQCLRVESRKIQHTTQSQGNRKSLLSRLKEATKRSVLGAQEKETLRLVEKNIDEFKLSVASREKIMKSLDRARTAKEHTDAVMHIKEATEMLRNGVPNEDKDRDDYQKVQKELSDLETEEKRDSLEGQEDEEQQLLNDEVGGDEVNKLSEELKGLKKKVKSFEKEIQTFKKSEKTGKKKPKKRKKRSKKKSKKRSKKEKGKSFLQLGGSRRLDQDDAVERDLAVSSETENLGGPSSSNGKTSGTSFLSLHESTAPSVHRHHHHHQHHHYHLNSPGDKHELHSNFTPESKHSGTGTLGHAEVVIASTTYTGKVSDDKADPEHQSKILRASDPPKSHGHTTHKAPKPQQDDVKSSLQSAKNEKAKEHTTPELQIAHHKIEATSTGHKEGDRKHDGHASHTTKDGSHRGGESHDKPVARKDGINADRPEQLLEHLSSSGDNLNSMFSDALKGMAALEATNQRVDGLRREVQKDVELLQLAVNKQKENALEMEKLEEAQRKIVDDQLQYLGLEESPRAPLPKPTMNADSQKDSGAATAKALSSVEKAAEARPAGSTGTSHTPAWICLWAAGLASVFGGALL